MAIGRTTQTYRCHTFILQIPLQTFILAKWQTLQIWILSSNNYLLNLKSCGPPHKDQGRLGRVSKAPTVLAAASLQRPYHLILGSRLLSRKSLIALRSLVSYMLSCVIWQRITFFHQLSAWILSIYEDKIFQDRFYGQCLVRHPLHRTVVPPMS